MCFYSDPAGTHFYRFCWLTWVCFYTDPAGTHFYGFCWLTWVCFYTDPAGTHFCRFCWLTWVCFYTDPAGTHFYCFCWPTWVCFYTDPAGTHFHRFCWLTWVCFYTDPAGTHFHRFCWLTWVCFYTDSAGDMCHKEQEMQKVSVQIPRHSGGGLLWFVWWGSFVICFTSPTPISTSCSGYVHKSETRMTASVLLLSCQQSSKHWTWKQHSSTKKDKLFRFSSHSSSFFTVYPLFECRLVLPKVCVQINKRSFEHFIVWISVYAHLTRLCWTELVFLVQSAADYLTCLVCTKSVSTRMCA